MPYHPGLLPSCLQRALGSAVWHLLVQTSYIQKDPLDGAASFFSVDRVTDQRSAQVMDPVNKWPLQRTHAREKLFAPGGNGTRIAQLRVQCPTSRPWVAPVF
jgi:hypothetical protein